MAGPTEGNLNSTSPSAPSGKQNVIVQSGPVYTDAITGLPLRDASFYPQPATTSLEGTIKLAGDLAGGSGDSPKVTGIQGIGVSATSPTNGQILQYDSGSGLYKPETISGAGGAVGPTPSSRRWAYFAPAGGPTSTNSGQAIGDGLVPAGTQGWITAHQSGGPDFKVPAWTFTQATSGSFGGVNGEKQWGTNTNILWQAEIAISVITNIALLAGVVDSALGSNWLTADTLTRNYAAFRFSTSVPDTNFQCITGDGTSTTVVDSGIAVAANTAYKLQIQFNDSVPNVVFTINGSIVATITTHLPLSGTVVTHGANFKPLASVPEILYLMWDYIECDS